MTRRSPKPTLPPFPTLDLEHEFWHGQGCTRLAGIDEAGRGAWAGPVVAAAVMLPPNRPDVAVLLQGVRDSKVMTPRQRDRMYDQIEAVALGVGVGLASVDEVDHQGVITATRLAMWRAIQQLTPPADALLIDAVDLHQVSNLPQRSLNFADSLSLSVAAASVIAKVTRDRILVELDSDYTQYGFARHKGYGTAAHRYAIEQHGVLPIHRKSYAPVAARFERQTQPQLLDSTTPTE